MIVSRRRFLQARAAADKQWGAHFGKLDSKGEMSRPLVNT